ncbi:unnamed protein product [Rotaria magnacalcarata]|uniref:Uncharacterized protein n=3 Tax=Rotaria magnacalcarata TaxID=392030 RepID=A0A816N9B7_9BILA|nr:unnamed protein product [Rotaria magnacalcarata]
MAIATNCPLVARRCATCADGSDTKNTGGATSSDGSGMKSTGDASLIGVEDEKYLHMEHKIILLIVNYLEELMMADVMATGTSTAPVKDKTSGKENW